MLRRLKQVGKPPARDISYRAGDWDFPRFHGERPAGGRGIDDMALGLAKAGPLAECSGPSLECGARHRPDVHKAIPGARLMR